MSQKQKKGLVLDDPRKQFTFALFTAILGVTPIDLYETEDRITFLVTPKDFKKIKNKPPYVLTRLSSELRKNVDIVIYSDNLELFVKNLFRPAQVESIHHKVLQDGKKALYVKVPVWDRGKALGKNSYKLYRARYFLLKFFGIDYVNVF